MKPLAWATGVQSAQMRVEWRSMQQSICCHHSNCMELASMGAPRCGHPLSLCAPPWHVFQRIRAAASPLEVHSKYHVLPLHVISRLEHVNHNITMCQSWSHPNCKFALYSCACEHVSCVLIEHEHCFLDSAHNSVICV